MRSLLHDYLLETATTSPDSPALVVDDTVWTFGKIDDDSNRLAVALQSGGVQRGDRVVIFAKNTGELVVSLWAALKAGAVFVVVDPTTKVDKLSYILDDCAARAVVAQRTLARTAVPAIAATPSVTTAVWIGGPPREVADARKSGTTHHVYDELVAPSTESSAVVLPQDVGLIDEDLAGLIYTSGSTGRPKGVMLTHRNIAHNTWSISTYLGLRADDVVACVLPLSFDYGLFQVFMGARVGCSVVLEQSFTYPRDVLERFARHRVTVLPGVPTVFALILPLAPFAGLDLSSIRMLTNTAATLPPAHIHRLTEAFPDAVIFSMYGLTECTRVSYVDPDRLFDKITSVGKAMPNTEAYVVDTDGNPVPPGVEGELVIRGASVMRGYWGQPEATAACLRDGPIEGEKVLYTGDQFRSDEEGFLYFVGRRDDVFKTKGEKVSPKEVEDVIYELEVVGEAAVVGVPHPIDGMAIKAVVAPREGAELSDDEVRRHCRARLEGHLVPRFVEISSGLPKTESGKIRKAALARSS